MFSLFYLAASISSKVLGLAVNRLDHLQRLLLECQQSWCSNPSSLPEWPPSTRLLLLNAGALFHKKLHRKSLPLPSQPTQQSSHGGMGHSGLFLSDLSLIGKFFFSFWWTRKHRCVPVQLARHPLVFRPATYGPTIRSGLILTYTVSSWRLPTDILITSNWRLSRCLTRTIIAFTRTAQRRWYIRFSSTLAYFYQNSLIAYLQTEKLSFPPVSDP